MIEHGLVCLLRNNKCGGYKTLLASKSPSLEKTKEVYFHNLQTLQKIIDFCKENNIKTHRVSSSLFPLLTYEPYRDKLIPILEEALTYNKIDSKGISLTMHPDQFILLSSINANVNEKSRYELDITSYITNYIPIDLINIHVGSANQRKEIHRKIFQKEFALLDKKTKTLLSLENDEKSYSFNDVLEISLENNCMIVPDFHHERCYQKRNKENPYSNHYIWNQHIDENIFNNFEMVLSTYQKTIPTFHLSSPIQGWTDNFKENCSHSDFIDIQDYPYPLISLAQPITIRMDIEAKAKDEAILLLESQLKL